MQRLEKGIKVIQKNGEGKERARGSEGKKEKKMHKKGEDGGKRKIKAEEMKVIQRERHAQYCSLEVLLTWLRSSG